MSVAQLLNTLDRVLADSGCCVVPCVCHFPLRAELLSLISASLVLVPSVRAASGSSHRGLAEELEITAQQAGETGVGPPVGSVYESEKDVAAGAGTKQSATGGLGCGIRV